MLTFDKLKKDIIDPLISKDKDESIHSITKYKANLLKDNYGIEVDTNTNSNFSMYTYPSSSADYSVLKAFKEAFTSIENYVADIKNHVSIPSSSTREAIITRFKEYVPGLISISLKEGTGEISFYLFFKDLKYGMTENEISTFLETKEESIFTAIHSLKGAGIATLGDRKVSKRVESNGQLVEYKYSLGVKKYVYMMVRYHLDSENRGFLDSESKIKKIYEDVLSNHKERLSRVFNYQDFLTPTLEYEEIDKMEIWYHLDTKPAGSGDDGVDISSLTSRDFEFKNENYKAKENEILLYDLSTKYIRIEKTSV